MRVGMPRVLERVGAGAMAMRPLSCLGRSATCPSRRHLRGSFPLRRKEKWMEQTAASLPAAASLP